MMNITDFHIGQSATIQHKITATDIDIFVDLTGDDNRLHVDPDYAKRTSFKKPVVHGMLGASFISTIIGTKLPGDGALWFSQNLEFILPARVGDTLTIEAEVIRIDEKQDILELRTDVFNQHKQKLISGTAKVKLIEQEEPTQMSARNYPKTALIIGASGGIGSEIALSLAKKGYDLCLHYHSEKIKAIELQKKIRDFGKNASLVQADLTEKDEVKKLIESVDRIFPNIYAVIFSATPAISDIRFDNLEWKDLKKHLDLNVNSLLFITQAL
jgi:3-oxoacyl-[acyl-carrier protein] reductase